MSQYDNVNTGIELKGGRKLLYLPIYHLHKPESIQLLFL